MKTMISFVVLLTITITTHAQRFNVPYNSSSSNYYDNTILLNNARGTSLNLQSASITKDYIVTINNQYSYALRSNNNTTAVNNLQYGSYNITVHRVKTNIFGKQRNEVLYNGVVTLTRNYETTLYINAFDEVAIQNNVVYNNGGIPRPINGNGNYNKNNRPNCSNDDDDRKYNNGNHYGRKKRRN
jgi:hypothetical protein